MMGVEVVSLEGVKLFLESRGESCDSLRMFLDVWPSLRFLKWHYSSPESVYLTGLDDFGETIGFSGRAYPLIEDANGSTCVVALGREDSSVYWVDLFAQGEPEYVGGSCKSVLLYLAYDLAGMGLEDDRVAALREMFERVGVEEFEEFWGRAQGPSRISRSAMLDWIRQQR